MPPQCREELKKSNYVVAGATKSPTVYMCQFVVGKIAKFRDRHGDAFHLVILGSPSIADDYYIIPWKLIGHGFRDELLHENRQSDGHIVTRWFVHIRNDVIEISKKGFDTFKMNLAPFKGDVPLLSRI